MKVLKPFFTKPIISNEKIALVNDDKVLKNDKEIAKVFNNFLKTKDSRVHEHWSVIQAYKRPWLLQSNKNWSSKSRFSFFFVEKKMKLRKKLTCFKSIKLSNELTFQQRLLKKI